MASEHPIADLDPTAALWDRFFMVAPLVVVGTREADGRHDLAPKHMATPLGWANRYAFVCSPRHATQRNIERTGEFTVSFPRPDGVVLAGLTAAPRTAGGVKAALDALPTRPARAVDAVLLEDAHLWLECRLDRLIGDFGENSLIVGEVVAASADERALRDPERDDGDLIHDLPLLAYLAPGRFAPVGESLSFPYPAGFHR
jgi:flavin reductase (DIM6/NTAB) family NADH-FMN oxidoreductase RutF